MSDFMNEDGEFLMTAAELRTEWELDQQSAQEQADEAWLDRWDDEDEWDEDEWDGEDPSWEDQHLDGMWEE